jgi:nucleotide-binding universal stress UspA family protein
MFKSILVPTDGSPLSDKAIDAAVAFAKECGGEVVGISVAEPCQYSSMSEMVSAADSKGLDLQMLEMAQKHVQKIAAAAGAVGVPCKTTTALSHYPHDEIINAANKFGCDIVFMSSHGRDRIGQSFLGSETQQVLVRSNIPVVVYR